MIRYKNITSNLIITLFLLQNEIVQTVRIPTNSEIFEILHVSNFQTFYFFTLIFYTSRYNCVVFIIHYLFYVKFLTNNNILFY